MNTRSFSVALLACCMLLSSCKKEDDQTPDPPVADPTTGTPTAIGTPVGGATVMTVDANGGTITSADGRLSITVPVGALTAPTEITIQPITNQCFGGAGLAYDLGPDGQHFEAPVIIAYHYTPDDLIGTDAQALRIAFQDDAAIWNAFANYTTDTIAAEVAILTDHFTAYAFYSGIFLVPGYAQINVNEGVMLRIKFVAQVPTGGDELLIPLAGVFDLDVFPVVDWTVNGDSFNQPFNGTLASFDGGNVNTYTAPAVAAGMINNPVTIGARMTHGTQNVLHLLSNIEVLDLSYTVTVEMSIAAQPLGPCTFGAYTDHTSFAVGPGNTVDPTGIANTAGSFGAFSGSGGCTCTMTEAVDYFDLASVTVTDAGGGSYLVALFSNSQLNPGYAGDCAGSPFDGPAGTAWVADGVSFTVPFDGESHTSTVIAGGKTYVAVFTPA